MLLAVLFCFAFTVEAGYYVRDTVYHNGYGTEVQRYVRDASDDAADAEKARKDKLVNDYRDARRFATVDQIKQSFTDNQAELTRDQNAVKGFDQRIKDTEAARSAEVAKNNHIRGYSAPGTPIDETQEKALRGQVDQLKTAKRFAESEVEVKSRRGSNLASDFPLERWNNAEQFNSAFQRELGSNDRTDYNMRVARNRLRAQYAKDGSLKNYQDALRGVESFQSNQNSLLGQAPDDVSRGNVRSNLERAGGLRQSLRGLNGMGPRDQARTDVQRNRIRQRLQQLDTDDYTPPTTGTIEQKRARNQRFRERYGKLLNRLDAWKPTDAPGYVNAPRRQRRPSSGPVYEARRADVLRRRRAGLAGRRTKSRSNDGPVGPWTQ